MATRGLSVTYKLREAVLTGDLPVGRVNEAELAAMLEVSRTPVRVALAALAAEGLLDYTPNAGYSVRAFTAKDIEGVYEVRAQLEGLVGRLAAENGLSDTQRGAIQRVLADTEAFLKDIPDDGEEMRRRWSRLNDGFHEALLAAADNDHLAMMLRKSRDIPLLKQIKFRWLDVPQILRAHEDHGDIFEAITRGNPVRAEALGREHVYRIGRRIVAQWRNAESRKPQAKVRAA